MSGNPELAFLSATELRRLMGRREVSPVEVMEACLAQVERLNPTLNAVCTVSERALDDARELERRWLEGDTSGALLGLPVGIKDTTPTAGLRTTFGSTLYADHVPDEDALVVERIKAAGGIVLGKTNTPEFAAGGNTYNEVFGATRNPWNPELSAGGSTGGGAAALASGMIALAEGSDLGGSLRMPASFCGVVGLRPAPGLVPTIPTDYPWDSLNVTGPMGRTAEDVALLLQVMAGSSPHSPLCQPVEGRDFVAAVSAGVGRGAQLAYCADPARMGIETEIERVCREAAFEMIAAGAAVEEVELDLSSGRDAFLALRGLGMVVHHRARLDQLDRLGPNLAGNIRAGVEVTTEQLAVAEATRARIRSVVVELLGNYDYLLTPCMAVPPFPVEQSFPETIGGRRTETYVDWFAPTFVLSLTGLPVASVPCGLDSRALPVGLQVVGRPLGEESVLALAQQIQMARPIGRPPAT